MGLHRSELRNLCDETSIIPARTELRHGREVLHAARTHACEEVNGDTDADDVRCHRGWLFLSSALKTFSLL